MNARTFLITGAAGFIGMHLTRRLLQRGSTVIGIDNLNDYYDPRLKIARLKQIQNESDGRFTHRLCDISDRVQLQKALQESRSEFGAYDYVINLAAQAGVRYSIENPHAYINSNITGFLNMLELVKDSPPKHFIYASSSSVYGGNTELPFREEDSVTAPLNVYAVSKLTNELLAETYARLYSIPFEPDCFFETGR